MKIITFILFLTVSMSAFAVSGEGECKALVNNQELLLKAYMSDKTKIDTGIAHLYVNNKEVARFFGTQLKGSLLTFSFSIKNEYGDLIEGRITSLSKKVARIKRISLPSLQLEFKDFETRCWTR